jgi:uncharacterized protein (UPF0332 family)
VNLGRLAYRGSSDVPRSPTDHVVPRQAATLPRTEGISLAPGARRPSNKGRCPADAALRAAIGRYYYAVMLSARDLLERSSPMPGDRADTTHGWVIRTLGERSDSVAQLLARALNAMRTMRNRAEYGEDIARLPEEAERMAKSCAKALGHVEALARR